MIYLDNSATTWPHKEVTQYISHINDQLYGNPSSLHKFGIEAERNIKKARLSIANTLDVNPSEIFFTSGGTEANNLAIMGYLRAHKRHGNHIITTKIEHPSVLEVCRFMECNGYIVDYIDVDKNGVVDLDKLKSAVNSQTALISIMYINNEMGSIQPILEIAKIKNYANRRGSNIAFHVDAIQAYGKIGICPKALGIDLMTISAHKIHGPKGVGAIYIRDGLKVNSIIHGGGQELSIRSGTENVSGICGFGLAAEMFHNSLKEDIEKVKKLKELFLSSIIKSLNKVSVLSPEDASPYIVNISFDNIQAEVLLHHLEQEDIFVSSGAACSSKKKIHSHVLKAMNVSSNLIDGAIRISLSKYNTLDEIVYSSKQLLNIVEKLNKI